MNDSADRPRYIETLPKRGYRFIFPVAPGERDPAHIETETRAIPKEHSAISGPRRSWLWAAGGAVGICMLIGFGLMQYFFAARASDFFNDDVFFSDSARSLVEHGFYGINGYADGNASSAQFNTAEVAGIVTTD